MLTNTFTTVAAMASRQLIKAPYTIVHLTAVYVFVSPSLVPRLSWNVNMYRRESLVPFLRKHDVIKMGVKQKSNVLCVVQPTMRSTLGVYDIQPPKLDTCSKLVATFALFPVLNLQVCPRTIKISLP